MKFKNHLIWLVLIVLVGFSIRIYKITELPLYGDELTIAFDAYSILKTGHDQTGLFFPITFPMGAGRPGGYVYSSIPFIAIFGPNALGVRMLSVFSGVGLVLLSFYLVRKILSEKIGLIAAGLISLSPWDISLSRGGFEAHFALFLSILATFLFIKSKTNPRYLIFSSIIFGLVIHTYPTYKLTLPLFLPLLLITTGSLKKIFFRRKSTIISIVILIFFVSLSLIQTISNGSEDRFERINLLSREDLKQEIIQSVNTDLNLDKLPVMKKIFHNKFLEYMTRFTSSYFQNFSVDFLFIFGDRNPRHNMGLMGGFFLAELIFIFWGVLNIFRLNPKLLSSLSFWILIAPLPTALLLDPHFLRSSFLLIPLNILSATGAYYLFVNSKTRIISLFLMIFLFTQVLFLLDRIYFLSPNKFGQFWSEAAKLASSVAAKESQDKDFIFLSDRVDNLEFAFPLYTETNPQVIIDQNKQRSFLNGFQFKKIANVYIGNIPDGDLNNWLSKIQGSYLYIGPVNDAKSLTNYQMLNGTDNTPILAISSN